MPAKTTMSVDPKVRDKVKREAKKQKADYYAFTNDMLLFGLAALKASAKSMNDPETNKPAKRPRK